MAGWTWSNDGFVVEAELTLACGTAERRATIAMLHRLDPGSGRRLTLGADKGYDDRDFVARLRQMRVTPQVKAKGSAIDGLTTRHAGYRLSQRKRKLAEDHFW